MQSKTIPNAEFDLKNQTISWTCQCGEAKRAKCSDLFRVQFGNDDYYLCRACSRKVTLTFLRSLYSLKMQERILERLEERSAPV
jgi:predicted SprT family Zn-dependent metalloprotease